MVVGTLSSSAVWLTLSTDKIATLSIWGTPLNALEAGDTRFALTLIFSTIVSTAFFLCTTFFDRKETESPERAEFFKRMETPIQEEEISGDSIGAQAKMIGLLGLVYGLGVCAFSLSADNWADRLPFIGSGLIVTLVCAGLYIVGLKDQRKQQP